MIFCVEHNLSSTWVIRLEVLGIIPGAFQIDFEHKIWSIEFLVIISLGVLYKYILVLVLSERL